MKLNEVYFRSGTVIIHFLYKPYQETNFKSVVLFKGSWYKRIRMTYG